MPESPTAPHRFCTVDPAELRSVLGIGPWHAEAGWLARVEWDGPPTDADGQLIDGCVFADVLTGLVVIHDPTEPLAHPYRCAERKAPLTVRVKPTDPPPAKRSPAKKKAGPDIEPPTAP